MDGRTSELLVVPTKQGNQPEGPCGGKGEPGSRTVGGKDEGNSCPGCLNKTAMDGVQGAQRREDVHRRRAANCCSKSRMREIRTSGSVGAPAGDRRGHPTWILRTRAPNNRGFNLDQARLRGSQRRTLVRAGYRSESISGSVPAW
jgi:hypothetical protein